MSAFGDDGEPRAWNELLPGTRVLRREQPVVGAPDDVARHPDAMQPLVQMRLVVARLPYDPRGGGLVLDVEVLVFRPQQVPDHLLGALLVVEERPDALLVVHQERVDPL